MRIYIRAIFPSLYMLVVNICGKNTLGKPRRVRALFRRGSDGAILWSLWHIYMRASIVVYSVFLLLYT